MRDFTFVMNSQVPAPDVSGVTSVHIARRSMSDMLLTAFGIFVSSTGGAKAGISHSSAEAELK